MSIINNTPQLLNLSLLTLFLLLHSATSSYPSQSSPSPSPSQSPSPSASQLVESPQGPSPTQSYSPPAPALPSHSPSPTAKESPSAPVPTPADDAPLIPTPPPEVESDTNAVSMNYVTKETKKSSGGNGVGVAFGLIGAACVVIFGGAVYKKRRDNIRRSRRYSAASIQLI